METHSPRGEDRSFAAENIIRDIRDLIHDVQSYEAKAFEDKKAAVRALSNAENGDFPSDAYYTVSDGLIDATDALDRAKERFGEIEGHLLILIERIEREALSAKVQSRWSGCLVVLLSCLLYISCGVGT